MAPSQRRQWFSRIRTPLFSIALMIPFVTLQIHTSLDVAVDTPPSFVGISDTPTTTANKEFNYTAYWQKAKEAALQSLAREEQQQQDSTRMQSPCPKVYVYDLSTTLNALDSTRKPAGFGLQVPLAKKDPLQGHLYKTNQYAFPSILLERFNNTSSSKCVTNDPNQADLFYAPILPAPKSVEMWTDKCSHLNGTVVRDALVHLNSTNACRHFVAVGKSHSDVVGCDGWFSNAIPELQPLTRLAYSHYSFVQDKHGAHYYDDNNENNTTFPNLVSVPYPSNLHYSSKDNESSLSTFLHDTKRTVLMNFMGKHSHGDVQVRKRIAKLCKQQASNKNICDYQQWKGRPDFIMPKRKATFCLEPAGDTPGRKSLSDSITFGCIPVLFSELTDNVAPWHWLDWKERARVLVPREDFVAGRIDLKKLLQSMPPDLLKLMKKTLKEKARQFQYSLDDDQEDGIRIILDNLYREALDKERQGTCGY